MCYSRRLSWKACCITQRDCHEIGGVLLKEIVMEYLMQYLTEIVMNIGDVLLKEIVMEGLLYTQ